MKKLFLVCLSLSLMITGCSREQPLPSSSFCYEMKTAYDGSISQTFIFPTFSQELSEKYSVEQIENYENNLCKNIYDNVYCNFYLNYWLKYIEHPNSEFSLNGDRIFFEPPIVEESNVIFSINYTDIEAWRFFNAGGEESQTEIEDSGEKDFKMIYTVESSSILPFLQLNTEGDTVAEVYRRLVNKTIKENFAKEDISKFSYNYEYRYLTPYERIRSNADCIKRVQEGTAHSWFLNSNLEASNSEIKIWAREPNVGYWYLFALIGIAILSIIVFIFYGIFKKYKNKGKNRYSIEK